MFHTKISRLASAVIVIGGTSAGGIALHTEELDTPPIARSLMPSDARPTRADIQALRPKPKPKPRPVIRSASAPTGNDFWRRLSNCESPTGVVGRHVGYFQFSWDTAAKVGIDGSESYEVQKAAAQRWASMVNPGTSAGWPHCWHVASR